MSKHDENHTPDVRRAPFMPMHSRYVSDADCITIAKRLDQCRSYSEVRAWYCWQGYGRSTTGVHLSRTDRVGLSVLPLRTMLMKLEVLLAACLCAHPDARLMVLAPYFARPETSICPRIYLLLRGGNHLNVPVRPYNHYQRPNAAHLDMPDFVYLVPFHFLNSSILVEAWFAAPTFRERRELIDWPTYVDTSSKHRLPISRVWNYEEMPPDLYRRTGSGNRKTPRLQLHPNLELIYSLLKKAIRHGNIRIKWRVRYQLLLNQAAAKSLACRIETQRRLFLSLIFGDVRDLVNYHPPGTIRPYDITSTVEEVLCVPACRQNITISTIPGFSLPAIGPYPRLPSHTPSMKECGTRSLSIVVCFLHHHLSTASAWQILPWPSMP